MIDPAVLDQTAFGARCLDDGEFLLACRFWTGGIRLTVDDAAVGVTVVDGAVVASVPEPGPGVIAVAGSSEVWAPVLADPPAPPLNTAYPLIARGALDVQADPLVMWQYLPALERAVELLGAATPTPLPTTPAPASGTHDSPTGHYVHLDLGGVDHRVYYEQAGQGIPVLMQHTAGANGLQYRHLFEMSEITDHFQLIAYDLPFHGKSVPPSTTRWWEVEYRLQGEFLRSVPVALAGALGLDRPVFMGCSVGGLLALDLAYHHPDVFRAVISLEGALRIGGDWENGLDGFWHPQVSNASKARMMEGLCAPGSPEAYVKEVGQVYSAGWPAAFKGDLYYYTVDYDLREVAGDIDTEQCPVHIFNGDYDWSGTVQHGLDAHQAIAGSTHTVMNGVGHFPMQENPRVFAQYLAPVLDAIRAGSVG